MPNEPLTPDQARSEMQQLRESPGFGVGETHEARNEKILGLAKVAYQEDSPTPDEKTAGQDSESEAETEAQTVAEDLGIERAEVTHWRNYLEQSLREERPDPNVTLATLRREWGNAFEKNLKAAQLAARRLPGPVWELLHYGAGDDPVVIKRAAELGIPMLEAQEKADQIKKELGGLTPGSPRFVALEKERETLLKRAFGTRRGHA